MSDLSQGDAAVIDRRVITAMKHRNATVRACGASVAALALGLLGAGAGAASAEPLPEADLVLAGGTIYSGGSEPLQGDVAISGDRIIYVGPHKDIKAKRVIDAEGLVVAPGFIDPHAHITNALTSSLPVARLITPFLTQGVTTAFIGTDGGVQGGGDAGVLSNGLVQDSGINFASYIGLEFVRKAVLGSANRAPSGGELERMKGMVAEAMCHGALGLSTGLFYAPQSFAKNDEVVTLAKVAAHYDGSYDTHIRDESDYSIGLIAAIDEAIAVGREAAIPVHIAHIKALGVAVQGDAPVIIERIEAARREGLQVHADQYPWSASGTSLVAVLVPRWAQDGGRSAMLARFEDPVQLPRIKAEMEDNLRRRGGASTLLITPTPPEVMGQTLAQVAEHDGIAAVDAAIAILKKQDAGVVSFSQSDSDIDAFMKRPWVVTSSDANPGHPRYYASFARKFSAYVKDRKVITLRDFIDRSTATTAELFSLKDRGKLRPGAFADVIAFDPNSFSAKADYRNPTLFSTGMRFVVVNGQIALEHGEVTGITAGRPVLHEPGKAPCP